jgi:phage-related protein
MFKFRGISSNQMKVIIREEDFIARASQRFEEIAIDGSDGTILIPLGYGQVQKELDVQIIDVNKIDDILSWLNGEGELEFNGRVSKAYFYDGFDVNRFVTLKRAKISYIRDPFWYKVNDSYVSVTTSVINEGNIYSKPTVKLSGSGIVDLSINGIRFKYTFTDPYVEIDCEKMKETYEGLPRSRNIEIGLDYPYLTPGDNPIVIHSGTCTIQMRRKDRWL